VIPPAKLGEPILSEFCTTTELRDVIIIFWAAFEYLYPFCIYGVTGGGRIFRFSIYSGHGYCSFALLCIRVINARHIFPIWRRQSSWLPKGPSLGGNTSFEPFSVRIGATVRPGRVTEKKYRRTTIKSQVLYFPSWGKAPLDQSCMVGDVPDVITCAKFQIEIFMGYDFTGGRIYDFLLIFVWALLQR